MKKFSLALITVFIVAVFATMALAAPTSYKVPESLNEYIQVKNTGTSALGKGAPVVFEGDEVVDTTQPELGVQGSTDTTAVVIGVCLETIEVGAVGTVIVYGFADVLVDEAVAKDTKVGLSTTYGEADDNNTNGQAIIGTAMEASSGRGTIRCFIKCK